MNEIKDALIELYSLKYLFYEFNRPVDTAKMEELTKFLEQYYFGENMHAVIYRPFDYNHPLALDAIKLAKKSIGVDTQCV